MLDLDDVDFLDSTGLGVIVGVLKRARTLGGDLRLVCTRPAICRVFEITALDRTMPLAESAEAAVGGADRSPRAEPVPSVVRLEIPPRRDHLALSASS